MLAKKINSPAGHHLVPLFAVITVVGLSVGCNPEHRNNSPGKHKSGIRQNDRSVQREGIDLKWDPTTGRGTISLITATHQMELRFQDRFDGYSGGLYPGSMNRPAVTLFRPGLDVAPVAIWCAQDESIWDHRLQVEFAPGWSENFGHGPDGRKLQYREGRIIKRSPQSVLLSSQNSAMPYEVTKWVSVHLEGTMVVRTQIRNISDQDVTFDLWSGDDPWVGDYGTSRGDVGWHNGQWVKIEHKVDLSASRCLGIADLQNSRWKTANYLCLYSESPLPTTVYFANSFAHEDGDVSPGKPLNSATMTAFNLGWRNILLQPGETFEISYAIGAIPNQLEQNETVVPQAPAVVESQWQDVQSLPDFQTSATEDPVRFKSERVEMHLIPAENKVRIVGDYTFENTTKDKQFRQIYFPFAVDAQHPYPFEIQVQNLRFQRFRSGILFPLRLAADETQTIRISYEQKSTDDAATYIVTSARTWNAPLDESVLVVEAPDCNLPIDISYPMTQQETDRGCHYETVLRPFWPQKEFTIRWQWRNPDMDGVSPRSAERVQSGGNRKVANN
jgi:hypothetical protein